MAVMRWALLFVTAVAACGNPAPPVGDDDVGPDAETPGDSGLELRWTAVGLGENGPLTVDECRLWLADLRIVGDAAPGDDRTYLAKAEIALDGGDPPAQYFDDAPPGRYSTVDFSTEGLSDHEPAWRLRGAVELEDDERVDLEIEDDEGFARSLPLSGLVLAAGETRRIILEVDLDAVLSDIDWSTMPREEGRIELDEEDPELAQLRARLVTAITIAGIE